MECKECKECKGVQDKSACRGIVLHSSTLLCTPLHSPKE